MGKLRKASKFVGPGYVRVGPVTAGVFGIGCLVPIVTVLAAALIALFI